MTTRQQQETLDYFRTNARDWREKAGRAARETTLNGITQRNGYVLQVARERQEVARSLDVGCGTGELVCALGACGVDATGVDFAEEMVDLARQKAADEDIARAHFACSSIFDFAMDAAHYDLISANGFIEYLSYRDMAAFFDRVAAALAPGGSFVVGSRNRLFNLYSMNDFTLEEFASASFGPLLREAVLWTTQTALSSAALGEVVPPQPAEAEHKNTGIDVSTRFQYTPLQLIALLRERGLRYVEVYPVHIHGVTPSFKALHPQVHASVANMLQEYARDTTQLLVHASTFMLHVKKD